jgi:hypothetical protein
METSAMRSKWVLAPDGPLFRRKNGLKPLKRRMYASISQHALVDCFSEPVVANRRRSLEPHLPRETEDVGKKI